jgi:hypothetical protein
MLTDVGDFHQIRIQTAFFSALTEGGLVHSGRAGTNYQTVEVLFRNGSSNALLTGFRAHIGVIFCVNDALLLQGHLHDFLNIHRCGNVTAAMTDKNTNSTHFLPPILSEGTHQKLLGRFVIDKRSDLIGAKALIGTLTNNHLPCSIDELTGLDTTGATLHTGKAAQALVQGHRIHKGFYVTILHVGHKLMGLDVHLIVGRAGCGAFAALHALQGIHTADFLDSLNRAH